MILLLSLLLTRAAVIPSQRIMSSSHDLLEAISTEKDSFFSGLDRAPPPPPPPPTGMIISATSRIALPASPQPVLHPPPGSYITAVGVVISAHAGDLIKYTMTWGIQNSTIIQVVPSGHILHVDRPCVINAFTLARNNGTLSTASPTIHAVYDIPYKQYGAAYLVPYHNQLPEYSGKLVRVNLNTKFLSYVRIHNVLTDFADYYSFRGQAPYKLGQLYVNDLSKIDKELVGFQGGFSAKCGSKSYGFLVPYFDGTKYSGKAVRIRGDYFLNVTSGFPCMPNLNSKCAIKELDFTQKAPKLAGFAGGFSDGCWVYFVPYFNGYEFASRVVRVHAENFTVANITILDLRDKKPELGGYFGGFSHRNYGYLVPYRNVRGPVGGVNTRYSCDGFKDVNMVDTQATNGGDHIEPNYQGMLVRFRLDNFTSSTIEVLDLTKYDPDLRGFSGGFVVGDQAILVPYRNRNLANNQGFFSKVVKVDLNDFSTVFIMDLSHKSQTLRGFVGGFAYGKYAMLVPYSNGRPDLNSHSRSEFGTVVRIDVTDFRLETVKAIDLTTIKRQQVPSFPAGDMRGFVQGFASGRHAYLVPYFNGARSGMLARIDMADFEVLSDLQMAGNDTDVYLGNDGIQVVDLELHDKALVGFSGGFVLPPPFGG